MIERIGRRLNLTTLAYQELDDMIDAIEVAAALIETIADRVFRKRRIMLLAGEPFFLSSGNNLAVLQECGGAVVIERGNAQNAHWRNLSGEAELFRRCWQGKPCELRANMQFAVC